MKTTVKQFDYFYKMCKRYVKYFGLYEWDLSYEHGRLDDGIVANCSTSMPQMSATIRFNTERHQNLSKLTNEEIRMTALHEVSHLLIAKLDLSARSRFITEDEIHGYDEEIVNRIFNFAKRMKAV